MKVNREEAIEKEQILRTAMALIQDYGLSRLSNDAYGENCLLDSILLEFVDKVNDLEEQYDEDGEELNDHLDIALRTARQHLFNVMLTNLMRESDILAAIWQAKEREDEGYDY